MKYKIIYKNTNKYKGIMNLEALVFSIKIHAFIQKYMGLFIYKDDGSKYCHPTFIKKK